MGAPAASSAGAATPMIRSALRSSFSHVVAVVYTAGTVFHVVRVVVGLDLSEMPYAPDVLIVVLGSWGLAGMVLFAGEVDYRGRWERVTHGLIVAHLGVSVALHAWILLVRSHAAVAVFGVGYSYFGALYFGFFAWRTWTMRLGGDEASTPAVGSA